MTRWFLSSGRVIAALALLLLSGCICGFSAYRLIETDGTTDYAEVAMPLHAPSTIPVYWKHAAQFDPPRPAQPDREYTIVGAVEGAAAFLWQTQPVLEQNFRRAARAVGGDAVIDARRGVFTGWYPGNVFLGTIIKWTPAATQPGGGPSIRSARKPA